MSGNCASVVELIWNIAPFTEVHFIGGLSLECRMADNSVVLVDLECRLLTYVIDCREHVQVQPPVLEHPPTRFDHAIGEYDVDLGYDPLDRPTCNECIHLRIEVRRK